jgi:hypothetical protein
MNELVKHLASGEHPVVVGGSRPSLEDLQRRATDMGYVFVKFTDTKGGTDLGVRVDREASDVSKANWQEGTGTIHVEGNLTLDYVPVRCVADIDLATLSGTGHLVVREEATA